jgi:hypothetical protein
MAEMEGRDVGRHFVKALSERDLEALRAALSEDVRFRLLLPSGPQHEAGAAATAGRFMGWFGDAHPLELKASTVEWVADRLAITYRFRLHDGDGSKLIEQHLMVDLDEDGRVEAIDLLCSGFLPLPDPSSNGVHRFDAGDLGRGTGGHGPRPCGERGPSSPGPDDGPHGSFGRRTR